MIKNTIAKKFILDVNKNKCITFYSFLFLFLVSLLVVTSGCTSKEENLTIWIGGAPQEVNFWEKLISDFEQGSGENIRLVRQPTDSDQRRQGLVISLEARQPDPDLFLMDVIWI
ncbi:MAG: hypothetical protein JXL67_13845, partial [Calditrichaeota bacterium]|nr:hypothetical protein [Calditrichota bacterium]